MQLTSKKVSSDTITYPHCPDTEQVVLGCMLMDYQATKLAMAMVSEHDFYTEIGKGVFLAIANLVSKGTRVDLLSVTNECRSLGTLQAIGGVFAITNLTRSIGSTELIERDCLVLKEFSIKRMAIQTALKTLTDAQADTTDPLQMLDQLKQSITNIYNNMPSSQVKTSKLAANILSDYQEIENGTMVRNLLKTGVTAIDNIIGGLPESGLVFAIAAASVGKTTLLMQMAINIANEGTICSVLSLETDKDTITRMAMANISQDLGVTDTRIYLNKIKSEGSKAALQRAASSPDLDNIILHEDFSSDLANLIKMMYADVNNGAKVIFIDYLQLISTNYFGNGNEKLEYICKRLQGVSRDLNVPIVVLSQRSRPEDKSTNVQFQMPTLTDARGSGGIEQSARIMIAICLEPNSYKRMIESNGNVHYRYLEVSILKNKNGGTTIGQEIPLVQIPSIYTLKTCTDDFEQDYLACCGGDTSNDLTNRLKSDYGITNPFVSEYETPTQTKGLTPISNILNGGFDNEEDEPLPF